MTEQGVSGALNDEAIRAAGSAKPLIALAAIPDDGFAEAEAALSAAEPAASEPAASTAAASESAARVDAEPLLLYRRGDTVRCWLNVCPHAGRRLDWAPGQFLRSREGHLVCAVHGASFELEAGACVAGPCRGQSLRAVAVVVHDGQVWLA